MCMCMQFVPGSFFRVGVKPGLWTLDWTMDWTLDWTLDWTSQRQYNSAVIQYTRLVLVATFLIVRCKGSTRDAFRACLQY